MFKKYLAMALLAVTLAVSTSPLWAMSRAMDDYTMAERTWGWDHGEGHGHGHGHGDEGRVGR